MLEMIAEIDRFSDFWKNNRDISQAVADVAIRCIDRFVPVVTPKTDDAVMEDFFNRVCSKVHNPQEVSGHADLLRIIFNRYNDIDLSEDTVKQMHGILYRYLPDKQRIGEYKITNNVIMVLNEQGNNLAPAFCPAEPDDVPRLMHELIDWTNTQLKQKSVHPIIVIGLFTVHFLAIHPFKDGNGRIARALASMLMLKAGYPYMRYASFDIISKISQSAYYRSLYNTHKTVWSSKIDYTPWLTFFILALYEQKRYLEAIAKDMGH